MKTPSAAPYLPLFDAPCQRASQTSRAAAVAIAPAAPTNSTTAQRHTNDIRLGQSGKSRVKPAVLYRPILDLRICK